MLPQFCQGRGANSPQCHQGPASESGVCSPGGDLLTGQFPYIEVPAGGLGLSWLVALHWTALRWGGLLHVVTQSFSLCSHPHPSPLLGHQVQGADLSSMPQPKPWVETRGHNLPLPPCKMGRRGPSAWETPQMTAGALREQELSYRSKHQAYLPSFSHLLSSPPSTKDLRKTSLEVQCLGPCTLTAEGSGFNSWPGN